MRLIDLIEDVEATSRRLNQRRGLDADTIARITADTLIRRDLSHYLQTSIGEDISDPAERLCATLLRMSEIVRNPAPVCAFYEGFVSGALQPCRLPPRSYAVRHHLGSGAALAKDRRLTSVAAAADGALGPLDHLAAFSQDGAVLAALATALSGIEAYAAASALLVGPSTALQCARDAWSEDKTLAYDGPVLHLGEDRYDCLYSVPSNRNDLHL